MLHNAARQASEPSNIDKKEDETQGNRFVHLHTMRKEIHCRGISKAHQTSSPSVSWPLKPCSMGFATGGRTFLWCAGYMMMHADDFGDVTLADIADKIKVKLSNWNGKMSSQLGRIQLNNSVIHSSLMHNFHVYSWPKGLLYTPSVWLWNFCWIGDIEKKKSVLMAWQHVCKPVSEGGVGLKNVQLLTVAATKFMRARFLKGSEMVALYKKHSSIWPATKQFYVSEGGIGLKDVQLLTAAAMKIMRARFLKGSEMVAYYKKHSSIWPAMKKSIWPAMKQFYDKLQLESTWLTGDGNKAW